MLDVRDQLGEGPHWDHVAGELLRVDIANGLVHAWRPGADAHAWSLSLDGEVSAVIPREDGGHLLAVGHELLLRDADGTLAPLAGVERELPDNRFNDCRCDPQGRLWAGTMSRSRMAGAAALYRLSPERRLEAVLTGTTISNGIGWSADGERMCFVDSTLQRIDAFDVDPATGALSNRRTLIEVDPADGLPDGLAIDAEDGIWVALFGGGALRRYDAGGTLTAHVELPVTNPTCPTFGGARLDVLYVTSARHRLSAAQLAAEPLAGALLALDPGVRGRRANRFRG
ncbi:MAG TPA: SMP-30/gluconolactonase/LRE family protein [Conexibacter sp.]